MPFTGRGFRTVRIDENGRGKLFFIFMTSTAFVLSGVLDREPKIAFWPLNTSPEVKQPGGGNQSRRYCDPPDVTSLAIYFDSREDMNDDDHYDLLRNPEIFFQSVRTESKIRKSTCFYNFALNRTEMKLRLYSVEVGTDPYMRGKRREEFGMSAFCENILKQLNFMPTFFYPFQTNLSEKDRTALRTEIFFDLGSGASYAPAFFLTSKYGSQKILGYSVLFSLSPVIFIKNIHLENFLMGFGLGVLEYSFYLMTFYYVPSGRNTLISFASVRHLGLVITELLLFMQMNRRYAFYVYANLTVIWFIVWSWTNFKSSRNEIHYLKQKSRRKSLRRRFPWRDVLGSRPVWMTITAIFGASCGVSCIFTAMKLYLKYIYYLEDKNMLGLSRLFHVGYAIICGLCFDYLLLSHKLSVTSSRRMIVYVSHFIPAGIIFILGFLGCNQVTPIVFYFLAVMMTGANYTGAFSSPLDLAPKYSGHILALSFTFKALGCLLMDYFVLYVLTEQVFMSWRFIFSLNALILLLTAIFFMLRGSGSVQLWNDPDDKLIREKKNKKIQQPRVSVIAPLPKPRTKSIYMVEKKILKVLHVQEPDKFTRVRAYSTSLPNERSTTNPPNIYRPNNKKRASIS